MKFEDITLTVKLSIGIANATRKEVIHLCNYVEEDEWNSLSDEAKEAYLEDVVLPEWRNEYIDSRISINEG